MCIPNRLARRCVTGAALLSLVHAATLAVAQPAPNKQAHTPPMAAAGHAPVEPAQIAEDFPDIAEMTGVVLLVYWSTLCPEEHHCDFTIIDHALDYWGKRGKKVILNVATVGHPMTTLRSGTRVLEAATPDWLLKQVATYRMAAPPIVPVVRPFVPVQRVMTTFPSYWDSRFLLATEGLVRQLARYDGNPALSKVRIGTGIVGEDNPSFDGLRNGMPGWSNIGWIQYCRAVTDIYRRAFTRSRLEFDIDRLGWISAKDTPSDRAAAEALVAYFNAHNIFLAMNGFDTQNVADWRAQAPTGVARSLAFIAARTRAGLEGAPLTNPKWQNIAVLAAAFRDIGADRLVLFADVLAR